MRQFSYQYQNTPISMTFHPAQGTQKAVVLYYHGGGLLWGSRDDLPPAYISQLTQGGYHLLCMDYLLAPECSLDQIHRSVDAGFDWFLRHREDLLGVEPCPVFLFGRSAGAYLALTLAHRLVRSGRHIPQGIVAFYGYHHLEHPFFHRPSPHYLAFPSLSPQDVPYHPHQPPRSASPAQTHFLLYVYARQQGSWVQMLRPAPDASPWGIPEEELSQLPPTFLAASTGDQDVPFSYSKTLSLRIPCQEFVVCHGLEHDFDRDPDLPQSREVYRRCLLWLDRHLTS